MAKLEPAGMPARGTSNWLVFAGLGLLAVVGGLALPRVMPAGLKLPNASIPPVTTGKSPSEGVTPKQAASSEKAATSADPWAYQPPEAPEPPDPTDLFLRLGIGTAVVLGLCVATLVLGKRWLRGWPVKSPGGQHIRVVESLPLGNRCVVHLLKVSNRQIVVGMDTYGLKAMVSLPELFEPALKEAEETTPHPIDKIAALLAQDG
jgi:flagellar biogenesis protein FliO